MQSSIGTELDFIEELRLRRWARENYVPADRRTPDWHSVVLDEMNRKDRELSESQTVTSA
ncbi:MAG: hypothetical protein SNJ75_02625 [Gemmataceae bacterium]